MRSRLIATACVLMLSLGAGVALAATQSAAGGATNVCVNDTTGLMRVATTCRESEHALTIGGGGGDVRVTQNGTFTVPADGAGGAKVLPLTGVTVSGHCLTSPSPFPGFPGGIAALFRVDAATGTTMDVFGMGGTSPVGRSSAEFSTQGGVGPGMTTGNTGTATVVVMSNGATATITVGGYADRDAGTCTYLWQATEAPN
jgi:hypothetical protein